MSKKPPQYDIESIRNAANKGNIIMSRLSFKNSRSLGYDDEAVKNCICRLVLDDFNKTKIEVDESKCRHTYDVYLTKYKHQDGTIDDLYIKLKQLPGNWIYVTSFHL